MRRPIIITQRLRDLFSEIMFWFNNNYGCIHYAPKKWHCSKRSPGAHWTGSEKVQPCAVHSGLFKIGDQRGKMGLSCVATKISETRKKVEFQSFDKVKYR